MVTTTQAILNNAPVATVSLNTHSPLTNDVLTATATKSDADSDPVTLTYVWKVNGTVKRTYTSSSALTDTFDLSVAGNGDKGQTVTVEVTPNDGTVNGTMVSDTATVANTAPAATVSLNTHTPRTNYVLTATATKSDADGDTVTLTYVWKVNGTVKQTDGPTAALTDTFDLSVTGQWGCGANRHGGSDAERRHGERHDGERYGDGGGQHADLEWRQYGQQQLDDRRELGRWHSPGGRRPPGLCRRRTDILNQ